jgi:hypothetical protein
VTGTTWFAGRLDALAVTRFGTWTVAASKRGFTKSCLSMWRIISAVEAERD